MSGGRYSAQNSNHNNIYNNLINPGTPKIRNTHTLLKYLYTKGKIAVLL